MGQPKLPKALGRRRACDFCCRKKIKCDAKSPKCSNCIDNDLTCLWTPGVTAAKAGVTKRQTSEQAGRDEGTSQWLSAIEHRLMAVESMISGERILSSPTAPPTWHNALVSPSTNDSSEPKAATPRLTDPATSSELLLETPFHQLEPWPPVAPGHQESSSSDHEHPYLHLPPLHTVFPIIKRYFATCNPALPIFHEATFYAMVLDWYSSESSISTGRDPATWAVINATMALALRQTVDVGGFNDIRRQDDDRLAREYMANAQSVMDILVTRDEDFKGLQTILCLSLLFASSPAPKPACVLVATAVKLVHRLRAHTKEGKEGLDAATALHRDRLFWVTYVLDRDMAMKSLEPYIQQENEYDVEPPGPSIPEDGVGVLISPDGTQKINIFHYRVKLALIQGSLHDTVHSVRARSMCAKKAKAASERLGAALWEWRGSLPDVFQHNKLRSWAKEGGGVPRMLLQLHLTYMMCFFMSFRLHTRDPGWLRQLLEFSDQYAPGNIQLHEQGKDSDASFRGAAKITVMLPDHWKMFPDAAREALDLVRMVDDADTALVWSSSCLYHASLTILIANNLTVSQHHLYHNVTLDMREIDRSLVILDSLLAGCDLLLTSHGSVKELNKRSKRAVKEYAARVLIAEVLPTPAPF